MRIVAGRRTQVIGDVDGDGVADFAINVGGAAILTPEDFGIFAA